MSNLDYISLTLEQQKVINAEQAWHYGIIPKQSDSSSFTFFFDQEKAADNIKGELEILFGKQIVIEKSDSLQLSFPDHYYTKLVD